MRYHATALWNRTWKTIRSLAHRGRGVPSHVRYGARPAAFENLETRTLMSLVGVHPGYPLIAFDSNGVAAYTASAEVFDTSATPLTYRASSTAIPRTVATPRGLSLELQVDNAGNLIGGARVGDDLKVTGNIDTNGDGSFEYTGTLLTGKIVEFGSLDNGTTDQYDFRFNVTGGSMAPVFAGKDIGLVFTSENSTFTGSFSTDFGGAAKGSVGPIAKLASVAGNVYFDANNDGVFQNTELGLGGAAVQLVGTDTAGHAVSLTTTTGDDGSYSFINLKPGTYSVLETTPPGFISGINAVGTVNGTAVGALATPSTDAITTITLSGSDAGINYNFAEIRQPVTPPGSITGFVYADANNNGLFDAGETPLANATVTLTGTDAGGNALAPVVTTTDDQGSYFFGGLVAGTYSVSETQPAGYLDGQDALNNVVLSGSNTTDNVGPITVTPGAMVENNNFGELAPATVSGSVYVDANNDGIRQATEVGIGGATVTLTGSNDLGPITPITVQTAADGSYNFTGLRPGTYAVTETQPASYLDGLDAKNNVVINGSKATDVIGTITVAAGDSAANNTFGELTPGSLSGVVFADANNDGLKQAAETGIGGVTLTLTGGDDLGAILSRTTTTASDGTYGFSNLRPGTYTVTETQPAGYFDGLDALNNVVISGSNATDAVAGIAVVQNANSANNTFGELAPAAISGSVYVDANNDGIRQTAELGIGSVSVTLTGANDLGVITAITVQTAADGTYTFANLRPGTYTVTETQPASYLDGLDAKNNVVINGSKATDVIGTITVGAGDSAANNTFGELMPGKLSGFVYVDDSNDGLLQDGEAVLGGVGLTLSGTDDLGAVLTQTTATAADGSYSFGNLRPGTYTVRETQPAGYLDGLDALNNVVLSGSNATDAVAPIAVVQNGNAANNNFGELTPASVTGFVYLDANNNGLFDAGETPLGGVNVTLSGANDLGGITAVTVQTAADGSYTFGNLRPGTYRIDEGATSYLDGQNAIGTVGGLTDGSLATPLTDTITDVALTSGDAGVNYNFGELAPASVTGFVYLDANNNGVMDAGETPLGGVNVTLSGTNDLGTITPITVQTAADGSYTFTNLRPGTYTIDEGTTPYIDGKNAVGTVNGSVNGALATPTTDTITNVALNSGEVGVDYDFGELRTTPGITLTKTVDKSMVVSGDSVTYTYTVTNTGNTTLSNVTVVDDNGTPGTTADDFTLVDPNALAAHASWVTTRTVTLNAAASSVSSSISSCLNVSNLCAGNVIWFSSVLHPGTLPAGTNTTFYLSGSTIKIGSGSTALTVAVPDAIVTFSSTATAASTTYDATAHAWRTTVPAGTSQDVFLTAMPWVIPQGVSLSGKTVTWNVKITSDQAGVSASWKWGAAVYSSGFSTSNYNAIGVNAVTTATCRTSDLAGTPENFKKYLLGSGYCGGSTNYTGSYSNSACLTISSLATTTITNIATARGTANGQTVTASDTASVVVVPPGSLSGYVYLDGNNNGTKDCSEVGIAGATVTLTGTNAAGKSITLTTTTNSAGLYKFSNLLPGTYTITETQPAGYTDGKDSVGSLGGTLGNDVVSAITLTAGANGTCYNFGETIVKTVDLGCGMTATIGYWQNCNGQRLINSLNGGSCATNLGNWLASNFSALFGYLAGKTNAQIAQIYASKFRSTCGQKTELQVLCSALSIYVTDSDLAGNVATGYGFKVSSSGTGAAMYNIGSNGTVLGLANYAKVSIYDLLKALNNKVASGTRYCSGSSLWNAANTVFSDINQKGDIA